MSCSRSRSPRGRRSPSHMASSHCHPLNIIVWGEAGDGKSTLINELVGKQVAEAGKKPGGVTKDLTSYSAQIQKFSVRLWDMPGAGDKDIPAYRVLEMLGAAFAEEKIDGLLILSSRADRISLGAQVVAKLMDLSFSNANKWSSVVLVGTKNDKYGRGDEDNFVGPVLAEFNETVNGSITKVCTCNNKNVETVKNMIVRLSSEAGVGTYQTPDASTIAETVCDLNGLPAGAARDEQMTAIMEQIKEDRETLRKELKDQREEALRRQQVHDQMMKDLQQKYAEQQEKTQRLMGDMRKDAEARERQLREQLMKAQEPQKGFRVSLWPPSISF